MAQNTANTMTPLRIAILIHTDDPVPQQMMRDSYVSNFNIVAPGSQLDFFNLLLSPELPVISKTAPYDLIILGGGTIVPNPHAQWLQELQSFEKKLLLEHVDQKVMGVCLGHQTMATIINHAPLEYLPEPELAVVDIPLTEQGAKFFNKTSQAGPATLQMHEFHQRYVAEVPPGFTELAKKCQILMSNDNRILTFQGHPEMTGEMMSLLLLSPASKESGYVNFEQDLDGSQKAKLLDRAAADHDGLDIFRSIINWVSKK